MDTDTLNTQFIVLVQQTVVSQWLLLPSSTYQCLQTARRAVSMYNLTFTGFITGQAVYFLKNQDNKSNMATYVYNPSACMVETEVSQVQAQPRL